MPCWDVHPPATAVGDGRHGLKEQHPIWLQAGCHWRELWRKQWTEDCFLRACSGSLGHLHLQLSSDRSKRWPAFREAGRVFSMNWMIRSPMIWRLDRRSLNPNPFGTAVMLIVAGGVGADGVSGGGAGCAAACGIAAVAVPAATAGASGFGSISDDLTQFERRSLLDADCGGLVPLPC